MKIKVRSVADVDNLPWKGNWGSDRPLSRLCDAAIVDEALPREVRKAIAMRADFRMIGEVGEPLSDDEFDELVKTIRNAFRL